MTDLFGPANAANSVTAMPADSRVFGSSNTFFKDCSSPTANDGTAYGASFFNFLLQMLRAAVTGQNIPQDNTNANMLLQAIQAAAPPYAADIGAQNALIVNVNQPGFTLGAGSIISTKVAYTITGAATIQVYNGASNLGTFNLTRSDLSALNPYDLVAGQMAALTYDGTEFQIPRGDAGGTGDLKWKLAGTTLTGWVPLNGLTIGSASSAATARANADCQQLYYLLWNNFSNTLCPVTGGRGGSASADWTANKPIQLPDSQCKSLIGVDGMGGAATTGRLSGVPITAGASNMFGSTLGESLHALATGELASHNHGVNDPGHSHGVNDPGHDHSVNDPGHDHSHTDPGHSHTVPGYASNAGVFGTNIEASNQSTLWVNEPTSSATTGISNNSSGTGVSNNSSGTGVGVDTADTGISTQAAGSGTAHNNTQLSLTAVLFARL
jgi:hypothetical protein